MKEPKLILQKIKLSNFKIFRSKIIDFKDGLNIITGLNATGKTTILKAIAYLKSNSGFRTRSNYTNGLITITPQITYYLNPKYLNLNIHEPLIITLTVNGYELINQGLEDLNLEEIRQKIEIKFFQEFFPSNIDIDFKKDEINRTSLPQGELKFMLLNKMLEESENSLILFDSPLELFDEKRKKMFYNKLKELSKTNQIIFTTHHIYNYNKDDVVLSLSQELPRYFVDHSSFYQDFLDNMHNIKNLMQIKPSEELKNLFYKMIHVNIITIMETFLSNAFIYTVTNNSEFLDSMLEFIHKDKKLDFNREVRPMLDDRKEYISKYILDNILFHKTERVKPMYASVLGVKYPKNKNFNSIGRAIATRHDIVHRNGRTKDDKEVLLSEKDILNLIENMEDFIKYLNEQLRVKVR